jgi:hypothetical protein
VLAWSAVVRMAVVACVIECLASRRAKWLYKMHLYEKKTKKRYVYFNSSVNNSCKACRSQWYILWHDAWKPEYTYIARQRLGKQVPAEMNTHATIEGLPFLCNGEMNTSITIEELLRNGVSCVGRPRLYNEDLRQLRRITPCGGGLEYLHRSHASRRRPRKGNPVPGVITGPPCSWGI